MRWHRQQLLTMRLLKGIAGAEPARAPPGQRGLLGWGRLGTWAHGTSCPCPPAESAGTPAQGCGHPGRRSERRSAPQAPLAGRTAPHLPHAGRTGPEMETEEQQRHSQIAGRLDCRRRQASRWKKPQHGLAGLQNGLVRAGHGMVVKPLPLLPAGISPIQYDQTYKPGRVV